MKRCWGLRGDALVPLLPRLRLLGKQRLGPASAEVSSSPKGCRVQGEALVRATVTTLSGPRESPTDL